MLHRHDTDVCEYKTQAEHADKWWPFQPANCQLVSTAIPNPKRIPARTHVAWH